MSEKLFKNRKEAVAYFSKIESGYAEYTDEEGVLQRIVKNPEDANRFSVLLSSFASTEDAGVPTTLEEVEALVEQGRKLGYEYTPNDMRIQIARLRRKK